MDRNEKITKMRALRCYGKWRENVLKWASRDYMEHMLDKECEWRYFISHSFFWSRSIEGEKYWIEISKK